MPGIRNYELSCASGETGAFVAREILPALVAGGYEVVGRTDTELRLAGRRRPRWAVALAVFLFPFGLVLLLVKRPRALSLDWETDASVLHVQGDDPAARHVVARFATERERPPGFVETVAAPFAAGATPVLGVWIASVQLVDTPTLFAAAIVAATVFGCGFGTLVGMQRASRSNNPRNSVTWGTLPALAGALAMTAAFVALIVFLLAIGAGD